MCWNGERSDIYYSCIYRSKSILMPTLYNFPFVPSEIAFQFSCFLSLLITFPFEVHECEHLSQSQLGTHALTSQESVHTPTESKYRVQSSALHRSSIRGTNTEIKRGLKARFGIICNYFSKLLNQTPQCCMQQG